MKKKLLLILISLIFLLLTACSCNHEWANATCITPVTCTKCGEIAGTAQGHNWTNATCTAPKTCSICKETDGVALGHNWNDATYSAPKTCSLCSATEGTTLTKCKMSQCDANVEYSYTDYCTRHDCSTTDCPYPAKQTWNTLGEYCIFHSCDITNCTSPKQQSNLAYCSSHLSHIKD